MKKVLIAVLLIMAVVCTSAFADNRFDNYSGFAIGYGLSQQKIEDLINVKAYQMVFAITDFGFVNKSPVGIFLEGSLFVDTSGQEYTSHSSWDIPKDRLPVGLMATIGPAFKLDLGKSMDLLLGIGFQVYRQEITYGLQKWLEFYYGVGADVEFVYELGRSFAISIGAEGSYFFANDRYESDPYHHNIPVSYDEYWEYRVIPKITFYYTF